MRARYFRRMCCLTLAGVAERVGCVFEGNGYHNEQIALGILADADKRVRGGVWQYGAGGKLISNSAVCAWECAGGHRGGGEYADCASSGGL